MITVSVCMIVKNEEAVLARCLDSLRDIADEIVIVDTGSTDRTKEVAAAYTDRIYDFMWVNDFSVARNFAFSKATGEYIYSADADEVLDTQNRQKFLRLKEELRPEIEIVQMYYCNQLDYNTTYNFDKELRPKLFKRLRTFTWTDPVHEQIVLTPVIFDSDIEILHRPQGMHAKRDFLVIERALKNNQVLSAHLWEMYARELFIAGEDSDFLNAYPAFLTYMEDNILEETLLRSVQCVVARAALANGDTTTFFTTCLKNIGTGTPSAEICCLLAEFYTKQGNDREAYLWLYNAIFEAQAELSVKYAGEYAYKAMAACCKRLGKTEEAAEFEKKLQECR